MKRASIVAAVILALCGLSAADTRAQLSQSFSVNTTVDGVDAHIGDGVCQTAAPGVCTLRAAVQEANAFAGQTFISVNNAGGTMNLTIPGTGEDAAATGDLDITGHVSIGGPGAVSGSDNFRVFHIRSGGRLEIFSIDVFHGFAGGSTDGGAFLVTGAGSTLEFSDGEISDNTSADRGGAVRVESGAHAGFRRASISNNTSANPGGGISVNQAGLTLRNVTVYNNTVGISSSGGGIAIQNNTADVTASPASKFATLNNVTIADNAAGSPGGGGLSNFGDIYPIVSNTVFSGNTASGGTQNCTFSGTGVTKALTSLGNNLANSAAGCFSVVGTDLQAAPGLALAALIHGITHLKPANSASAVANKGGTFSCEPGDAVGTLRPQGSGCDIGAIELAVGFIGSIHATPIVALGQSVTVTVLDADLRFQSDVNITAQSVVNGTVFESETLTLENFEFTDVFTATFPVKLASVPSVDNGILDILGEGMIRFIYSDTPNGVSETGFSSRFFETQVTGLQSDIVTNASFEIDLNDDKRPDGWEAKNLSADRLRCNKPNKVYAIDGVCAFEMKNTTGVLSQNVPLPLPVGIDDDMFFEVLVNTTVARPGVIAKIVIKENDGDKEQCKINLLAGTNAGAGGYQSFQCNIEPDLDDVKKVKITLSTPGIGSGKVLFDRVSLLTIVPRQRAAGADHGPLSLPEAPQGFRR